MEFVEQDDQESISQWAGQAFPSKTPTVAAKTILEESIELALELGIPREEVLASVTAILDRTIPKRSYAALKEEAADVYICLAHFCNLSGFWLPRAVKNKMDTNRARPLDYYRRKQEEKKAAGIL